MGALIFDEQRRILLIERGREPLRGWWSLPGGVLETGETIKAAVAREALEETGLVVEPLQFVTVFERIIADAEGRAEYHYVLIDYICRVSGGALCAGDDCASVRWVDHLDVAGISPLTEGTLGVIEQADRMLA